MSTPRHDPAYQPTAYQQTLLPATRDLIDGRWSQPGDTRSESIEDPNTGAAVQPQRATTAEGIEAALASAERAHAAWQGLGPAGRAEALMAMADHIEPRTNEVASWESATSGAVIGITSMLGFITHAAFRLAASQITDGGCSPPGSMALRARRSRSTGLAGARPSASCPGTLLHPWQRTRWRPRWLRGARSS